MEKKYSIQEFVNEHMLTYDFLNNSIAKFCKQYNISHKTVKKLCIENNIPIREKKSCLIKTRDSSGKFISSIFENNIEKPLFPQSKKNNVKSFDLTKPYTKPYTKEDAQRYLLKLEQDEEQDE